MHIKTKILSYLFLAVMLAMSCAWCITEAQADSKTGVSIVLLPRAQAFDIAKVPLGSVRFTAVIKNAGTTAITIAHPSTCLPEPLMPGESRRFQDSHAKSEILLKVLKPDGSPIVLRDGYLHYFDPGNVPLITIPPQGTGTFEVGWFFPNERGRWERDEEAAKMFLLKGFYRVRILLRNVFPSALLHDEKTGKNMVVDVWTGELESPEITIEVK
jgi:hypothetical protein